MKGRTREEIHEFVAREEDDGLRLDSFLATHLSTLSPDRGRFTRARVQRLIDLGLATLDGGRAKSSSRLKTGAVARIQIPEPRALDLEPEAIPLAVLHEDSDLIVIDKPAGLAVHPGAGRTHGTVVNALLAHCTSLSGIGDVLRPGIVHRLDKDTSGVLVAAKSDLAHQSLSRQFHDHSIDRRYRALVWGAPPDTLTIDARLARDAAHRTRFAVVAEGGKRAVTHLTIVERFARAALVECRLETGRTHQIRVHLQSRGFPVVGDALYGGARGPDSKRQMLHALLLGFEHPRTGTRMSFTAPLPVDMAAELERLRAEAPRK